MGQITGAIAGMGKAAEVLATPVVSGNVSLYNETDGQAIDPAPVIGMVGSIDDIATAVGIALPKGGETIFVIGQDEITADGWLGASVYADLLTSNPEAAPPPVNLDEEKRNGDFLRQQILAGHVTAAHDISDGGLLCAVTEMALASGGGAEINLPDGGNTHGWCFGEDQGRYVIATADGDAFARAAASAGVPVHAIGASLAASQLEIIERRHYLFSSDQKMPMKAGSPD